MTSAQAPRAARAGIAARALAVDVYPRCPRRRRGPGSPRPRRRMPLTLAAGAPPGAGGEREHGHGPLAGGGLGGAGAPAPHVDPAAPRPRHRGHPQQPRRSPSTSTASGRPSCRATTGARGSTSASRSTPASGSTWRCSQGRLPVSSNQAGLRSAEDMVLLATASDYLGIVQGQDLVDVEQKNLELAGRRRKQAQAFYEAGEQTKVDVLRAETDQKAAERALAAAQQQPGPGGQPAAPRPRPRRPRRRTADPGPAPDLKFPPLPPAEALVAQAEASRPTVQRAELALQIASSRPASRAPPGCPRCGPRGTCSASGRRSRRTRRRR